MKKYEQENEIEKGFAVEIETTREEIEKMRRIESLRVEEKPALELALSRFTDACFLLRRSIVNAESFPTKERLLFYIDKLIGMDILFSLTGVENILYIMGSLVEQKEVTMEVRHQVIYVSELLERIFDLVEKM